MNLSKIIAIGLVVAVGSWFTWVMYKAGEDVGITHGYVEGFNEGKVYQRVLDARPVVKEEPVAANPMDDWMEVNWDGRKLYVSKLAAPRQLPEFMNYLYTDEAAYAFAPNTFTFEEIYELVLKKLPPKETPPCWNFGGDPKLL